MAELLTDCGRLLAAWGEGDRGPERQRSIDELQRRVADADLAFLANAISAVRDA